jgi:hypothetical protein
MNMTGEHVARMSLTLRARVSRGAGLAGPENGYACTSPHALCNTKNTALWAICRVRDTASCGRFQVCGALHIRAYLCRSARVNVTARGFIDLAGAIESGTLGLRNTMLRMGLGWLMLSFPQPLGRRQGWQARLPHSKQANPVFL